MPRSESDEAFSVLVVASGELVVGASVDKGLDEATAWGVCAGAYQAHGMDPRVLPRSA